MAFSGQRQQHFPDAGVRNRALLPGVRVFTHESPVHRFKSFLRHVSVEIAFQGSQAKLPGPLAHHFPDGVHGMLRISQRFQGQVQAAGDTGNGVHQRPVQVKNKTRFHGFNGRTPVRKFPRIG